MSERGQSQQKRGVEIIIPPSSPPSDTPNAASEREVSGYEDAAAVARLTPTERIWAAYLSHRADLQAENSRVLAETKDLRVRFDRLQPRYAALLQASRTNSAVDVVSLVFAGLGASAISAASLGFLVTYAHFLFGGGITALFLGYVIMAFTKLACWPKYGDDDT